MPGRGGDATLTYSYLQHLQHLQQKFLPDIFYEAWIYNSVREIGENSIVLRNMGQLRVPFARISLVEKLPLVSFSTTCENFSDKNIKFIRNKIEFNVKLKTYQLKQLSLHAIGYTVLLVLLSYLLYVWPVESL
jgi:hypothetical protein